jgi:hypothetical protein
MEGPKTRTQRKYLKYLKDKRSRMKKKKDFSGIKFPEN